MRHAEKLARGHRQRDTPCLPNDVGILHHDNNASPHMAQQTGNLLQSFGWETLFYPSYTTVLHITIFICRAPWRRTCQNYVTWYADVKPATITWVTQQGRAFFGSGMGNLWHAVKSVSTVKGTMLKNRECEPTKMQLWTVSFLC
jgi:hypothetical protein